MKKILLLALLVLATAAATRAQDYSQTLFSSPESPAVLTAPSYRIPALAQCNDGSLLAVADYRYGLSDVGAGARSMIELHFRRSQDLGRSWTDEATLCSHSTQRTDWKFAMGDAALVADRESGEVLLLCAAGNTSNGASTAQNPIRIGQFRSHDGGQTWDEGEEVTQQIYGLYEGDATAIFITSGSLRQSRYIKQGDFYRIYAAHPLRTATRGNTTSVIYSDDFGRTWHVLGGAGKLPTGTVYEEGKVEEMPDGNVALMVRDDRGTQGTDVAEKNFNFFSYSDVATGQGEWTEAASGITGMANACNSALLMVPARRTDGGQQLYVALVALPTHTVFARNATDNYGRRGVAFYYKEVASPADYSSGTALAAGWQPGWQATELCSAYTDLILLNDGCVALLMEDNGRQGRGDDGNNETEAYDIVFHHLTLETITGGLYEADPGFDGHDQFLGLCPLQAPLVPAGLMPCDLLGRRVGGSMPQVLIGTNGRKQLATR